MEKFKIRLEDGDIETPNGFEFSYSGESGLEIGQVSNDLDLAIKISLENGTEYQTKEKYKGILQGVQSDGILKNILGCDIKDEKNIKVIITRIV